MADPRIEPPDRRRDQRSALIKAQSKAQTGQKVNFCPYNCTLDDVDEHGYCRHLIGFTNDGKTFEPMILVNGRRVVRVTKVARDIGRKLRPDEETQVIPMLEKVLPSDKLVPITISSRVYRDVDKEVKAAS